MDQQRHLFSLRSDSGLSRWACVGALALAACTGEQGGTGSGALDASGADGTAAVDGSVAGGAALTAADLFETDTVKTLRIEMTAQTYAAMQQDVQALVGSGGGPGGGGGGPTGGGPGADGPAMQAACTDRASGEACTFTASTGDAVTGTCATMGPSMGCKPAGGPGGGGGPGSGGGAGGAGGALDLLGDDPIWVEVDAVFEGAALPHVGMRYKGNSSLSQSVQQGLRKLPFRLDFDRYEDDYPETKNQRLAGFGKMTFSSNFGDDSQVREALAATLLAEFGLPAARWTFVRVYVDAGAGERYWGLYTMVEDPSDKAFRDHRFGSHDGNLYKPDGATANWTSFVAEDFEKKNHDDEADFSDVQGAVVALHADRSDAASWRAGLEARLDVDGFLRWLAANTVIANWDAYGQMAHNYYLYADPEAGGQLVWIPWDHNFAFVSASGTGGGAGPGSQSTLVSSDPATAMLHATVGDNWPLIAWLLDDPVYVARYRELLAAFVAGPGAPEHAAGIARTLHERISDAVAAEEAGSTTVSSAGAFADAIDGSGGLAALFVDRAAKAAAALALPEGG